MGSANSLNDEQLVALLKQADSSTLGSLHNLHHKKLHAIALRITGSPEDAQDVVQDTFFQLWQKSSQFDSTRGSLIGWLLAITRHRAIERIRERNASGHNGSAFDETTLMPVRQPTALDREITRQLVAVAATNLTELQRSAITLAYFEELTFEEIASRTQTPLGTVKQRVRCSLRSMKASLARPPRAPRRSRASFPSLLKDVVITDQLENRSCRRRDPHQEANSLRALGELTSSSAEQLIDFFVAMPLDLCRAGSGGLSLLEMNSKGEQQFRWISLSGKLAKYVGGSTPRDFSPCGVTLDCDSPQLFKYPSRYFHYFNGIEEPIVEGLVIPFNVGGKTEGTIWIASHQEGVPFDSEDVRIMTTLAEFVGSAVYLSESLPSLFTTSAPHPKPVACAHQT